MLRRPYRTGHIATLLLVLGFNMVQGTALTKTHETSHDNFLIPLEHAESIGHFAEESAKRLEERSCFSATVRSFLRQISPPALCQRRELVVVVRYPRTHDQQLLHLVSSFLLQLPIPQLLG